MGKINVMAFQVSVVGILGGEGRRSESPRRLKKGGRDRGKKRKGDTRLLGRPQAAKEMAQTPRRVGKLGPETLLGRKKNSTKTKMGLAIEHTIFYEQKKKATGYSVWNPKTKSHGLKNRVAGRKNLLRGRKERLCEGFCRLRRESGCQSKNAQEEEERSVTNTPGLKNTIKGMQGLGSGWDEPIQKGGKLTHKIKRLTQIALLD